MALFLLMHFLWWPSVTSDGSFININTDVPINTVEPEFISYTLDTGTFMTRDNPWRTLNHSSPLLHTLMRGLSPSILRIGGTTADSLWFDENNDVLQKIKLEPDSGVITKNDIDILVQLTQSVGNRLVLGVNLQLRYGTQWNPINAVKLLQYASSKGYGDNMDFELGNEPNIFGARKGQQKLSAEQIGLDFITARRLLDSFPNFKYSRLLGPDCSKNTPGSLGGDAVKELAEKDAVHAITIHHYYFEGLGAKWENYVNPHYYGILEKRISEAQAIVKQTSHPNIPVWIGETADSWHGGTVNVSDRYVSGFLWLENLGRSARMGVNVVMRQQFYGPSYGLVNYDLSPKPDYWLSLMHRTLCEQQVLNITSFAMNRTTRVYGHCTNTKGTGYTRGSITVFAINLDQNAESRLYLEKSFGPVDVYLMTPGEGSTIEEQMLSKTVAVNGQVLKMVDDNTFPTVKPVRQRDGSTINVPTLTFGFFVYPFAEVPFCV